MAEKTNSQTNFDQITDEQIKEQIKHLVYGIINDYEVNQALNNYKLSHIGLREDIEELIKQQVLTNSILHAQAKNVTKAIRKNNDLKEIVEELMQECNDLRKIVEQQKLEIKKLQSENTMLRVRASDLEKGQDDLANEIRDINDRAETQKRLRKVY